MNLLPACTRSLLEPLLAGQPRSTRQQFAAPPAPPLGGDVEAAGGGGGGGGAAWAGARELIEEPPVQYVQSSLWDTTINLTNAILGAGMLAMPRAFAGLGVLGGGAAPGVAAGVGCWALSEV